MGKSPGSDLFQLVQSLSAAEKRSFRLLAERHSRAGGNAYLQLFDALCAMKVYNEKDLREKCCGKTFQGNFSEAKAFLYKSILRTLRFLGGPNSVETELRETLANLELLFSKGLLKQAAKAAGKGLQKSKLYDQHSLSEFFLRWQRRLAKIAGDKNLRADLERIGKEEALVLNQLTVESRLRDLLGRIQSFALRQAEGLSRSDLKKLDALGRARALSSPPVQSGFHALTAFYQAKAYYFLLKSKPADALTHWFNLVKTWEKFPHQVREQPGQYVNALTSLLDTRLAAGSLSQFTGELEKLKNVFISGEGEQARIFFVVHHLLIRYALATGELEEALGSVPELETGMEKFRKYLSLNQELTLLYNTSSLFFHAENFPEAQKYFNLILNRPVQTMREDITDAARLLEMVSRFERGHYDVLEHLIAAQERRNRQQPEAAFSKLLTRHLGAITSAVVPEEISVMQKEMLAELEAVPAAARPPGYNEVSLWLQSRLSGKRMRDLLR